MASGLSVNRAGVGQPSWLPVLRVFLLADHLGGRDAARTGRLDACPTCLPGSWTQIARAGVRALQFSDGIDSARSSSVPVHRQRQRRECDAGEGKKQCGKRKPEDFIPVAAFRDPERKP